MEKEAAAADFWAFVILRQQAYWQHRSKQGPPYSQDQAIARFHFCNVYREADRGTIWFHEHCTGETLAHTLFSSLVYRTINRIDTFDAWGGIPTPATIDRFLGFIIERMAKGGKVFTGRHLTTGVKSYHKLVDHITVGNGLDDLAADIENATSLKQVVKRLIKVPGIGAFFGWQVACDLVEAGVLPQAVWLTVDDWVQLGPGAARGAKLIAPDDDVVTTAKWLLESQPVDGLLVPPASAPGSFTLKNVEHALCEYVRWKRASDTDVKNVGLEVREWAK